MRLWIGKYLGLGLVGLMAFIAMPMEPARAQTTADINAAVAAAASGDSTAIATFIQKFGQDAVVKIGDAVAAAINAGGPGVNNLSTALVATGDSGLISGVMVANGMTPAAQKAIAGAVVQSGNVILIATIQQQVQTVGGAAVGALSTALANSPLVIAVVAPVSVPPIVVIVPSPAQTLPTCTGSCN